MKVLRGDEMLTFKKASEILDINLKEAGDSMPPDVKETLELSKQAFDLILFYRTHYPDIPPIFLLGEEHG